MPTSWHDRRRPFESFCQSLREFGWEPPEALNPADVELPLSRQLATSSQDGVDYGFPTEIPQREFALQNRGRFDPESERSDRRFGSRPEDERPKIRRDTESLPNAAIGIRGRPFFRRREKARSGSGVEFEVLELRLEFAKRHEPIGLLLNWCKQGPPLRFHSPHPTARVNEGSNSG